MSAPDADRRGPHASLPLGLRLRAWWHGYDLQVRARHAGPAALAAHGVGYDATRAPWDRPDLKVPQMIWGEGFLAPGGTARSDELVKPLGLDETMSVLEIGAGLGGQTRTIARSFGTWVTGIEADRGLADIARMMSEKDGLAKKAQIHPFDPGEVEFRQRAFDVALSTDALYRIEPKERLLAAVSDALKGRCQVLIVDYVRGEAADRTALETWAAVEQAPVHLWDEREYRDCLNDLKFDVRVCSDVSAEQRRTVIAGFAGFLDGAARSGIAEDLQEVLVREVERWTRLVAALDSGAVRAVRLYAQRAQREALLSDW
jgi:2-polyprenyl-3-methyl-5-hydroxy-6-metoxy-1,4-benzoquinol methylase